MEVTSRALPDVLNKKGFFIARRAVIETPKASAANIKAELGRVTKHRGGTRTMKLTASTSRPTMSLAEAILRARIYLKGGTQPTKQEMQGELLKFLSARMRSIAFLKSGWLPAIRKLESAIREKSGLERMGYRDARQVGAAKGDAIPARPGFRVRVIITNSASARRDARGALLKYGGPALQRAVDYEAKSMLEEIARREAEEAKRLGILVRWI